MEGDRRAADVLVIGGGYSGTMAAAELARRGLNSVLADGSGREGRGTAYSTSEDAHLLNVVASRSAHAPIRLAISPKRLRALASGPTIMCRDGVTANT